MTFTKEQLDKMVWDADIAHRSIIGEGVLADVCCHVKSLAAEVERLQKLETAAVEYVAADDALGGTVDTWTSEGVERFDTTEKRFYALCRETTKEARTL